MDTTANRPNHTT